MIDGGGGWGCLVGCRGWVSLYLIFMMVESFCGGRDG